MLVLLLFLMAGLSGAAHALMSICVDGHCHDHVTTFVSEHHTERDSGESTDSSRHKPNGMELEECNSYLCNALALTLESSDAVFFQSKDALAGNVSRLSTLEEPDNPDRPPNL